ncbi:MAG: XdhC family protein [Acidimicrobiia bacterium]
MSALDAARQIVAAGRTGALVTVLSGPHRWERLVVDGDGQAIADPHGVIDDGAAAILTGVIGREATGVVELGNTEVFVEVIGPGPTLVICGAGPIAEALSAMATPAGFTVDVIDPRRAFVRPERFPMARSVRQGWPDQILALDALDSRTYVVSLLHEARFEADLFPLLLSSSVRYIGALGSRRTHAARLDRLRSEGFEETDLERIHGPVGLDIGAETPEEIAVSILAEMVVTRRGADRLRARANRSRVK